MQHIVIFIFIVAAGISSVNCAYPGSRAEAATWFTNGTLWLFGGTGYSSETSQYPSLLNDLWSYDIATNTWSFVSGSNTSDQTAVYGDLGTFSDSYYPGGTRSMCSWFYNNSLWIFGGETKTNATNDLNSNVWRFDLGLKQWSLMSGMRLANPSNSTMIGARSRPQCVIYNNIVYVFGGLGVNPNSNVGYLGSIWTLSLANMSWVERSGDEDPVNCPGTITDEGQASTTEYPPCQQSAMAWLDPGLTITFVTGSKQYNSIDGWYRYNTVFKWWVWNATVAPLTPRDLVASATDGLGSAWLFGGSGSASIAGSAPIGFLADLLEWNADTSQWILLKGSKYANVPGQYPAFGSSSSSSYPGARQSPVMWRDYDGNLWLFGGNGYTTDSAQTGFLNDLWQFNYVQKTWTWVGGSKDLNQPADFVVSIGPASSPSTPEAANEPILPTPSSDQVNTPAIPSTNPPVFPSQTDQVLLGVLIPAGVIAAGLVVLFVLLKRHKKNKKGAQLVAMTPGQSNENLSSENYVGLASPNSSTASNSSHLIPYSAITLEKEIGQGSFGKVYLGKYRTTKVAVKVAHTFTISKEEFIREANFQQAIPPHPNIVQLLGISVDGPQPLVVLEYCNQGSLDKVLFESNRLNTAAEQIALAEAVARGVDHLHQNQIVHRDLAARNILLHHGEPKISDFGMSRKLKEHAPVGKTMNAVGPLRWMAPESLSNQEYSNKSDVWTYGLVLYEIVAREEPHSNDDLLTVGVKIRDEGHVPNIPQHCPPLLAKLMEMCWRADPAQRPDMSTICELFDKRLI